MNKRETKKKMVAIGRLGGQSGHGKAKARGGPEYYRALARARWGKNERD